MNTPITIKMLVEAALTYWALEFLCGVAGLLFALHMLSGGYWPSWYYKFKQNRERSKTKNDLTTLGL